MTQDSLSVLSLENDAASSLDRNGLIKDFSNKKSRKHF